MENNISTFTHEKYNSEVLLLSIFLFYFILQLISEKKILTPLLLSDSFS